MIRVAALALVLTGGAVPDGGGDAPRVASVRHALAVLDDGRTVELDGGVWLSTELAIARAQDLERLSAENRALRTSPTPPPLVVLVLVSLALGAGVAAGYLIPHH